MAKISGSWSHKHRHVQIDVQIINFEEDGIEFIVIPALDLTGYGRTIEEAEASVKTMLDEFLRYTINKGTLEKILQALGWHKSKKHFVAPKFSDQINANGPLREILDEKKHFKVRTMEVEIPAFA